MAREQNPFSLPVSLFPSHLEYVEDQNSVGYLMVSNSKLIFVADF